MASEALQNSWLNTLTRNQFFVAELSLGLLTVINGELVEITAPGYARREIEDFMSEPKGGVMTNELEIQFEPADEDWPDIYGIAIFDGDSHERLLERRIDSISISKSDVLSISEGALDILFEPELNVSHLLTIDNYSTELLAVINPALPFGPADLGRPANQLESAYTFDFTF